jgi:hypothetical protein
VKSTAAGKAGARSIDEYLATLSEDRAAAFGVLLVGELDASARTETSTLMPAT